MKNMSDHNTNPVCWKLISDRGLITETMREKSMTRAEAFRWLYQCAPVFGDNDVKGGNHG
ncbi:hypothetical protein [Pantoea sp. CCBC3-3-1]|uniref:hypothetical protein n=1 Tax=Pantoea sp. CCBC3-3-1 TaxID=2490851 RepID=UPI0011BFD892|nr:hypothetical protein [Pantoea sp. CCBC3-3-1]